MQVINPPTNVRITVKVKGINKMGILAICGPMHIVVAKQQHENQELFKDIEQLQNIEKNPDDNVF